MNSLPVTPKKKRTPETFGRYKVKSLLGEGAMGRVYLAIDPVLDRQVAVKVIFIHEQTEQKTRDEYLGRFNVEARAGARLNHPSIVTIFDAGEQNGIPWIAFEYVNGEPLQHLLEKPDQIPMQKILAVTMDITSALHHAHESGIIHRDVKPANILIDKRTGISKLADFGVVKAPWVALTQDGSTVGSPGYMSPEQLDGRGCDSRSDLFSLGVVIYQMLTGKHPFMRPSIPATILATLSGKYTPVHQIRPDCPPYLEKIVSTLLKSDPTERFQSAAMLLHELRCGRNPEHEHQEFDTTASLGNVTRLHRISHALINRKSAESDSNDGGWNISDLLPEAIQKYTASVWKRYPMVIPAVLAAFFLILGITLLLFARGADERSVMRALTKEGYRGSIEHIIDTSSAMIASSTYLPVKNIAALLHGASRFSLTGDMLAVRVGLNEPDDDAVLAALKRCAADRQWKKLRVHHLDALTDDCKKRLTLKRADTTFAAVLADAIFSIQPELVTEWMASTKYWLRWNSVRLARHLSLPVDSTTLYLLDLKHAGSTRTRAKAATRLGELGDARAVPALEEAADLGYKNIFVSRSADRALKTYFTTEKQKSVHDRGTGKP